MKRILVLAAAAVLGLTACHFHFDLLGESELKEVTLVQTPAREKILVVDIDGVLSSLAPSNPLTRGEDIVAAVYGRLRLASRDPMVKAVILRLNTPGGEVTASDLVFHEVTAFKERTKLPVVALMMDLAASGGFYAAMAADWVVALPSTLTGSIGVISIFPQVGGLMDKVGVGVQVIKSGALKDAGSPFRQMTEDERRLFQQIIDQYFGMFLDVVVKGRRGAVSKEELARLADGRVWTAPQAKDLKLVDEIGYVDAAVKKALSMAGLREADLVRYTYYPKTRNTIYSIASPAEPSLLSGGKPALGSLAESLKTGFYYLWLPETGASSR